MMLHTECCHVTHRMLSWAINSGFIVQTLKAMSTLFQVVQEIESIEALVGNRPRFMVVLASPNARDHYLLTTEFPVGNYHAQFHQVAGCDLLHLRNRFWSSAERCCHSPAATPPLYVQ